MHLALACVARSVHADPEVALDRLEPAPAGDVLIATPDFDAQGHRELDVSLLLNYAHEPLALNLERTDGTSQRTVLVDHELLAHLGAAFVLSNAVVFDAALPAVLSQGGDEGRAGKVTLGNPKGADVGDLRLGARLALLEQKGFVPGAAFTTQLWFPTATGVYAGSRNVRASAGVAFGTDYSRFLWRLHVGARYREASGVYAGTFGSEAFSSFGLGYRVGKATFGGELLAATSMDATAGWFGGNTSHLEALLSASYELGPVRALVAGGPGLTRGAGTPAYRVLLGVNGSFELGPSGKGGAGSDRPTAAKEPAPPSDGSASGSHVAPSDRDRDGLPDAVDQCPDEPGEPDAARPGCPPDRDGDGIADAVDHCPDEPGVKSADPTRHGCPPDRDEDGIADALDACPEEKGEKTSDPKTNGCPTAVRVVGKQIVIMEQVNFATGSDVLVSESFRVLQQVAGVLGDHPEIARLAVDGHTDNVGQDKANLALSRRRAIAVVRWLVEHGVDERRLEARGFGARQPIAEVNTKEGRAKNRRVEFQVLKKTDQGARGWKDGPIDE